MPDETTKAPAAANVSASEPFGTVEGGIPLPESMKDVPLIDAKDVPPLTFETVAAPVDYDGPDESVKCAYPPCTRRLRKSSFPGPQWCSKQHRSASEDGVAATVLTFRIEERRTATVKVDVAKHCAFYPTERADFDGTDEEFVKHSLDCIGTYDLLRPAEEPDDGIDVLDIEDDAEIEPW